MHGASLCEICRLFLASPNSRACWACIERPPGEARRPAEGHRNGMGPSNQPSRVIPGTHGGEPPFNHPGLSRPSQSSPGPWAWRG